MLAADVGADRLHELPVEDARLAPLLAQLAEVAPVLDAAVARDHLQQLPRHLVADGRAPAGSNNSTTSAAA